MEDAGKLLVVDDEAELRALLARYLGSRGYTVRQAADAGEMDRLLAREHFDVLILDLMLPGEDGLSACRRLRTAGDAVPILMLTARGDPIDRIIELESGADDYLPKPFEPRELLARIEAMIRRQRLLGAQIRRHADASVTIGRFRLDTGRRRLLDGDAVIALAAGEFDLLAALAANRGRPLGRDRLVQLADGPGATINDRSIDVRILRLRRAIEDDPAQPRLLLTVRGKGYMLAADAT
ncbi:two-component system response regulator OmpR [Azoarcus sp. DD4]|uniref:response regulator n=1 Tax=Azoarcus sp. DD4 TaxID=2027405 RepID=UPI00112DF2CB|nr:response regulator [Azoarcus sp. DD4]QDF99108.1 two-component system response regulator OmpR [Azoarcus sp. DD4]